MENGIGQSAFVTVPRRASARRLPCDSNAKVGRLSAEYRSSPPHQARWFGMANVLAVPCDVTDPEQVVAAASHCRSVTIPMYSAYPTSKAALKIFTQHPRMKLAPFGIGVTNLVPGSVETPMMETGAQAEERQWASIPEPLRDQYRQHFQPSRYRTCSGACSARSRVRRCRRRINPRCSSEYPLPRSQNTTPRWTSSRGQERKST